MPEDSPSNLDVLWDKFKDAPYRLAEERRGELRQLMTDKKVEIKFDKETLSMRFEGLDLFGLGLVNVGIRGLERLWAFAYGIAYVQRRINEEGKKPFRFADNPVGQDAALLIQWAIDAIEKKDPSPWPDNLPRPQAEPEGIGAVANALFVGASGFAVLHEIGHIVLGHKGAGNSKDVNFRQEFEADEWAYNWIMDRWTESSPETSEAHTVRATLISSLFSLIAINQIYLPGEPKKSETHPNIIDRLLRFLIKHANEDAGYASTLPWSVPVTAIQMHLPEDVQAGFPKLESYRIYLNLIRDGF